ncbi:4-hydroxybenzoate 3-monooxygenase [Catenulispora rubra]|uniref:4-hydroxybenzoate 3-monooxygenase n=1 Tax=Catenulispora rubra TaxID=280293 RepID=UPI002B2704B2|nr:4-hydroxybenzoate 3-monooxygenase [Catenulispora rubra]
MTNGQGVIVLGAGPAGLVSANILNDAGVDCVVLERSTREHVRTRARAGYLAPNTVRILERHGLAEGVRRRGRTHGVCEFRTETTRFRLEYEGLGAREPHTVYPQQDLVADLLARYVERGGRIVFGVEAQAVLGADGPRPEVLAHDPDGAPVRWSARYIAGCDGRHGAARRSIPAGAVRRHRMDHGVSWLGLLAEAPPSLDAVGYAVHGRGFAGHMARSADVTRYYLQCERGAGPDAWSEEQVWQELSVRLGADRFGALRRGPIVQRAVVDLESDVLEPLRYGSLLLAGDAASLISPSAAKGANLAVLEAELLAEAFIAELVHGDSEPLERYSHRCLERIWRAQEFSGWMVRLLHGTGGFDNTHGFDHADNFDNALRHSRLESLRTSRSHQDWFAENYVGV